MIYDENVTELSIRDAFKALNEIDHSFDDALRKQYGNKLHRHRRVNEGVSVSLSGVYDEDELQTKLSEEAGTTLKVIDINADTVEHLRDGKDYVGQLIAKCKVCQALRFMDLTDMKPSDEDSDLYNVDEECPHCHSEGKGFTIVGQVGEAPKEEVPETEETEVEANVTDEGSEATADAEEEATLPNDEAAGEGEELELETEETETVEADEGEAEESSTTEADVYEEEPEQEYDETDAEDDTLDLELPQLGDEIDPDDVEADDTEEVETEEETEEKKEEKEVKENLNEEKEDKVKITSAAVVCESVEDLLNNIVNSDCIDDVYCLGGEDDEDIVYNGSCEELPTNIRKAKLKGFNVCGNTFIINIDRDAAGCDLCLRNLLDKFTDNTCDNISLCDVEDDCEVFYGTKEDAVKNYGDCAVWSIDKPKAIQFVTDCNAVIPWSKEEVKDDEYSNLIADIIRSNGLKEAKINNPKCIEYWIAESIRTGEDLDLIYKNYVSNQTEELRQQFKESTGYKDDLDIAIEKREGIAETAAREDDVHKALEEAKELAKDTNAFAVIYGYKRSGKFYQLPKMYSCRDDKELKIAHDAVVNKYHTSGMIYTYYRGEKGVNETLHDWSIEDEEAEKTTIDRDANTSVMIEEVKEWAKHDLENNSILVDTPEDKEEFRKLLDKFGFKDYDLNELFNWYLTTVGQLDEELNKDAEEETEVITEAAQLSGKNDDINKGADVLDKKLTGKKYDVVVVTDDSYPNTVGVLAKDKDTIGKVKNDSKAIFDELGWKVGKITDSEEDGLFTVMFENITIEKNEEEPQEQAQESLQHFATRKELSEAVMKLKKAGEKYQINKSLREGYRYELKILNESYNPDDFATDTLDAESEEYETEQKALSEIETEEFDERTFDDDINEYFDNTYDETVIYETLSGSKDKEGNILLEGVVTHTDKEKDIKFLLEKVEDGYIVKNNLSEEVFEFKF